MQQDRFDVLLEAQRDYFRTGATLPVSFRVEMLKKLRAAVGESGMGAYHGKEGFEAFSHRKSIVDKKTWMDLPMRYQPYRGLYEKALRLFLR